MKNLTLLFLITIAYHVVYGQGGVGIGTNTPHAPLQFSNEVQLRKIVLNEIANNDHQFFGFGTGLGVLRYQVDDIFSDHVFFSGIGSANSLELMRIKGYGYVGIRNDPSNLLDVGFQSERTGIHSEDLGLYVTTNTNLGIDPIAKFSHANATQGIGFGYNTIFASGSNTNQDLNLAAKGASGNLTLITNGLERLRINGSGNLGLGVVNPLNTLDIHHGTARSNTHPGGSALYVTGNAEFRTADATAGLRILSNAIVASGNITNVDLSMVSKGTGSILFGTNNAERMRITDTGVGIGVTTPHAPLQFANYVQSRKIVLFETANNDHRYYGFGVNPAMLRYQTDGPWGDHTFFSALTDSTSRELMRIKGNGNVGIGINPTNMLDIGYDRLGIHPNMLSLYVTKGVESGTDPIAEFRRDDASEGIGFGYNTIFATGSNANQDLNLAAKGANGNLTLTTNGLERLRMNGSGNLGLGVANPLNTLDIHRGTARSNTHPGGSALYVTGNGEFRSSDATVGLNILSNSIASSGSNTNIDLSMATKGTGNFRFSTNGTNERMRITATGVGIGTTTTNAPLQFSNDVQVRKIVLYEIANNDHEFYGFGLNAGSLRYQIGNPASDHIFHASITPFNSKELLRIKGNGNIGIGMATPHAPLQFSNSLENRKIVLWELSDNDHQFFGFGVNADGTMRYQVPATSNDHIFYSGTSSSTSTELMRIGSINGLEVTVPTYMQTLTVTGTINLNGVIPNEPFITPTLLNGFSNYEGTFANAAYYKDKEGRVCLRGLVKNVSDPDNKVIFTLPAGHRPSTSGRLMFPVLSNDAAARVDIMPNGDVLVVSGSSVYVSLDGITFRAD